MATQIIKRLGTAVLAGGLLFSVAGFGGCPRQAYETLADMETTQDEADSSVFSLPGSDRMFNPQPEPPADPFRW